LKSAILSLTFGLVFALSALPAQAAELKIAVVDVGGIFQQLPQRQEISERLQEEFSGRIQQIQEREQELSEMQERLRRDEAIMSESELEEAARDFQMQVMQHRQQGEELQEAMQRRQQEERNQLLNQMGRIINDIAEAEGYDLVLEANGVAFARQSLDISERVYEQMSSN